MQLNLTRSTGDCLPKDQSKYTVCNVIMIYIIENQDILTLISIFWQDVNIHLYFQHLHPQYLFFIYI